LWRDVSWTRPYARQDTGARVVLCARDAVLDEVRGAIKTAGGAADVMPLDPRQPAAPSAWPLSR